MELGDVGSLMHALVVTQKVRRGQAKKFTPTSVETAARYCLMSLEKSSTFEKTGSSVHEIENPKVSL